MNDTEEFAVNEPEQPSTPTPPPPGQPDPSQRGLIAGLAAALAPVVIAIAAKYGFDLTTEQVVEIGGLVGVLLGPIVAALVTRLRAWHPDTVSRLQADALALLHEVQGENPPSIVTGPHLSTAEASEAHPGALGLSGPGEEPGTGPLRLSRARHEKP